MRIGRRSDRWILVPMLLLCCGAAADRADETPILRQGELVVLKSLEVQSESEGHRLPTGKHFPLYTVEKTNGDRLLLMSWALCSAGWFKSSDVVALERADEYFSERIRSSPGSAPLYFLRGSVRVHLAKFESGIADLGQALRLEPSFAPAYVSSGCSKCVTRDYAGAEADFNEALRLDRSLVAAYLYRSDLFLFTNRRERAIADLSEAIRLEPANGIASGMLYCKRGRLWLVAGDHRKAKSDYDIGVPLAPGAAWAHSDRGHLFSEVGELALALSEFDEAIRIDPNSPDAYAGRASIRLDSGDLTGALKDSTEQLRVAPESAYAYGVRGAALWQEQKLTEALHDLNRSLASSPNNIPGLCVHGLCCLELRELDLAIYDFGEILRHVPNSSFANRMRARAWCQKREFAKALSDLDEAIRKSRESGHGYLDRAYVCCATGKYDRALADLNAAARADRTLEQCVAAQRSWIQATCPDSRYRDGQRAIENAQRVLGARRGTPALNLETERIGSVLMAAARAEAGDFDSAVTALRRAIELYKSQRTDHASDAQIDGVAWLEKVLKSLEQHRAYREEPADTDIRVMEEVRQPNVPGNVLVTRRVTEDDLFE